MSRPQIPTELESIQPFLRRADELQTKDPIISYWCGYHAVKMGMKFRPRERESTVYLSTLLKALEATKKSLRTHEAITNENVGRLYVKNFAEQALRSAEEEDRSGRISRSTAKKFLEASQIFDILSAFEGAESMQKARIEERQMYAKRRASELSKRFKSNRAPSLSSDNGTSSPTLPDSPKSFKSNSSQTSIMSSPSSLPQSQATPLQKSTSKSTLHATSKVNNKTPLGKTEELERASATGRRTQTSREVNQNLRVNPPNNRTRPTINIPPVFGPETLRPRRRTSAPLSALDEQEFSDIIAPMATLSSLVAAESTLTDSAGIIAWSKLVLALVDRILPNPESDYPGTTIHPSLQDLTDVAIRYIMTVSSVWSIESIAHVPVYVAEALYLRGTLRASGRFAEKIPHDPRAAFDDFEAAAKMGYPAGWFRLGQASENSQSLDSAKELFEYGAKFKETNCLYRLGNAHLLGELGLPVNIPLALELFREAADHATIECPHPPYVFAIILLNEFPGVTLQPSVLEQAISKPTSSHRRTPLSEARRYIQCSSHLGFGQALYRMGRAHGHTEMGCDYDPKLSVKYYLAASQRGMVEANMALSKWYLRGAEGQFEKNIEFAMRFARRAANGGSAFGMFTMGFYSEMGVGVHADPREAIKWYTKAAAKEMEAPERVASLRKKFTKISPLLSMQPLDEASIKIASSSMSLREMFNRLLAHGCVDLTSEMDPEAQSHSAIYGGAFGDVYCGKLRNGTTVAIKALRRHMLIEETAPKALKRAMREIYIWSKAKHENIQPLMGIIMFRGCLGMVSSWMTNGNMETYLQNNPGVNRHEMSTHVAHGVAYLHDIGMVHGDLKARNVLVDQNGIPKLSDFDHSLLSKYSLAFTETTNVGGGTLRWMAPELLLPDEEEESTLVALRTTQTDIYALGMTILEIFTSRLPYSEYRADTAVIMALSQGLLPKRPKELLSQDDVWALLMSCWNPTPEARPTASLIYRALSNRPPLPVSK